MPYFLDIPEDPTDPEYPFPERAIDLDRVVHVEVFTEVSHGPKRADVWLNTPAKEPTVLHLSLSQWEKHLKPEMRKLRFGLEQKQRAN